MHVCRRAKQSCHPTLPKNLWWRSRGKEEPSPYRTNSATLPQHSGPSPPAWTRGPQLERRLSISQHPTSQEDCVTCATATHSGSRAAPVDLAIDPLHQTNQANRLALVLP